MQEYFIINHDSSRYMIKYRAGLLMKRYRMLWLSGKIMVFEFDIYSTFNYSLSTALFKGQLVINLISCRDIGSNVLYFNALYTYNCCIVNCLQTKENIRGLRPSSRRSCRMTSLRCYMAGLSWSLYGMSDFDSI